MNLGDISNIILLAALLIASFYIFQIVFFSTIKLLTSHINILILFSLILKSIVILHNENNNSIEYTNNLKKITRYWILYSILVPFDLVFEGLLISPIYYALKFIFLIWLFASELH